MLVIWSGPFQQMFAPSATEGSTLNLATIDPMPSEDMFENIE